MMYFSNIKYDVLFRLTKFETKIQFGHRETKNEKSF